MTIRQDEAAPRTLLEALMRQRYWSDKDLERAFDDTARELKVSASTAERTIRRWRAGDVSSAPPVTCKVLEHMFGAPVRELFSAPSRGHDEVGIRADGSPKTVAAVRKMVKASANDARRISSRMESTSAGWNAIQMYRDSLKSSCAEFLHQPVADVFEDLDELRTDLSGDIEAHRYHPRYGRELLALLGMTSVVLAHASHLLGHPNAGMTHARLARLCADHVGFVELRAWACGTQALIAEGTGHLRDAIAHVRTARQQLEQSRIPGSAAVRLASYEARIAARLSGDRDHIQAALTASEQARDVLRGSIEAAYLDDIGGILEFPEPKAEMYAGQVHSLAGHAASAERHAQAAIDIYLSSEPEQRSYGDIALARIDIATARLTSRDLDGVREALIPVFSLPVALRPEHLRPPLTALVTALRATPYLASAVASDIRHQITHFETTLHPLLEHT